VRAARAERAARRGVVSKEPSTALAVGGKPCLVAWSVRQGWSWARRKNARAARGCRRRDRNEADVVFAARRGAVASLHTLSAKRGCAWECACRPGRDQVLDSVTPRRIAGATVVAVVAFRRISAFVARVQACSATAICRPNADASCPVRVRLRVPARLWVRRCVPRGGEPTRKTCYVRIVKSCAGRLQRAGGTCTTASDSPCSGCSASVPIIVRLARRKAA
jgi:hypothetical protein